MREDADRQGDSAPAPIKAPTRETFGVGLVGYDETRSGRVRRMNRITDPVTIASPRPIPACTRAIQLRVGEAVTHRSRTPARWRMPPKPG